jgi:hypothetical protein
MGFGSALSDALSAAGDSVMGTLRNVGAAASDAGAKAAALAKSAAQATADAAERAADAATSAAKSIAGKTAAGALVGTEAVAVAGAGVTALGVKKVADGYSAVKAGARAVKEAFSPHQPVAQPCLPCLARESAQARKERIERRRALIAQGQASNDPAVRAAASELNGDMKAVEMARLSENTYAQYDPTLTDEQRKPPEPWQAMTPQEAQDAGISPDLLGKSKAVIYKVPDDFPFDPKTVVAFRGTTGETEDILTDHDQALGMKTAQYDASRQLGMQLGEAMPDAEVTGHSLGGGKAQVAGIAGGLKGEMFNSAGVHPNSLGLPADGLGQYSKDFIQYRSDGGVSVGGGDPLTGIQNSLTAQKAVYRVAQGLQGIAGANKWASDQLGTSEWIASKVPESSRDLAGGLLDRVLNVTPQQAAKNFEFSDGKWYIPPALGEVRGVPSKTADGEDSSLAAQHSIVNHVYGIESRKSGDIQTLLAGTDNPGPAGNYIGPMVLK